MTVYANVNSNFSQKRPLNSQQVKNNAGGYVYEITPQQKLERFLLLGSDSNTYYTKAQELTEQNSQSVISYIKTNGIKVLDTILNFTSNNRAPKMDATLFVLALCATHGDQSTKNCAYLCINKICKTSTHLFMFIENVTKMRGWSRGLRNAISEWYISKSDDKLAYQLVKYRQRNGWTHRDVLRLAHPLALTQSQNDLFKYAVGKATKYPTDLIIGYEHVNSVKSAEQVADAIAEYKLTWEMVPTEHLNDRSVLQALLVNMPTIALIRNLGRYSKAGLTDGNTSATRMIKMKLNEDYIRASGIHPLNVVNAMRTYAQGYGDKGNSSWPVNQSIVDSLSEAYYYAIQNIKPTGKNILVALDVSPSMSAQVGGMGMSAAQVGSVLALTMLKSEPNVELIDFCTSIHPAKIGKRTSLDEVIKMRQYGNGTDCSLAFKHANNTKNKYDAIIILTDNQTWAGKSHGETELTAYRRYNNKDVKVIEIAMVANPFSTLPANDPNLLRIVGFDSACVNLINEFIK
jgi:60 kDa SS-A/Ro ribonucleoprotein